MTPDERDVRAIKHESDYICIEPPYALIADLDALICLPADPTASEAPDG